MTALEIELKQFDANSVKEIVVGRLIKEKIISKEEGDGFCDKWQIIVIQPSWFKRWAEKQKFNFKNQPILKIVKFED